MIYSIIIYIYTVYNQTTDSDKSTVLIITDSDKSIVQLLCSEVIKLCC